VPPPAAASDLYTALQRYQLLLLSVGRRLWKGMAPADFDGSWQRIAPRMVAFTSGAQLAAAQAAGTYVPVVLDQQGIDPSAEAAVRAQAFAGVAFDGRPLDTLLEGAVRAAKGYVAAGRDGGDALAMAQRWLEGALQTVVTDAARDMTAAEIAVRPQVTSWVRVVNPPCCSRCAVLAGVVYKWNRPNPRHPRCDCFTLPTTVANADEFLTKPHDLVRSGQITDLTADQRRRLNDGADLTRVLNESRDAWRVRMAVERKAAKEAARPSTWGPAQQLPPGGIQDFLSHLTSRVDAINELKRRGIAA
jgi:hypothetical protein